MKKLRFRVWDNTYSKMIYDCISKNYALGVRLTGEIIGFEQDKECEVVEYPKRFTLMEHIDIRDLWEDDIIEFRTFDGVGYIGVIKWGEFCYEVETTDDKAPVLYLMPDVINFDTIKLLGNIHEHPHLLGGD